MSNDDKLILEIEVPDFNAEGIAETMAEFGEDGETVLDYLRDADIVSMEVALVVHVPTGDMPLAAHEGVVIGARLGR